MMHGILIDFDGCSMNYSGLYTPISFLMPFLAFPSPAHGTTSLLVRRDQDSTDSIITSPVIAVSIIRFVCSGSVS
ncbi:hypothetical protein HZ326_6577 [Fusarium oxysporum f. sp. albedinis]|nr:hypothetical protein HZ326_6577 [Fusarium oxysporum f. sp. albedinis]